MLGGQKQSLVGTKTQGKKQWSSQDGRDRGYLFNTLLFFFTLWQALDRHGGCVGVEGEYYFLRNFIIKKNIKLSQG